MSIALAASPTGTVGSYVVVTLTASGTSSPFTFTQTAGQTVTLTGTGATRTFTAPAVLAGATLTFQASNTANETANVSVTVAPHAEWMYVPATAETVTLLACSDVQCQVDPGTRLARSIATSDLAISLDWDYIINAGDAVYDGLLTTIQGSSGWPQHWGRPPLLDTLWVVPGNHDYNNSRQGFDGYFTTDQRGPTGTYYRSADFGSWHGIFLNVTSDRDVPCSVGSTQYNWLAADLAANSSKPTFLVWHEPRYTIGDYGDSTGDPVDIWDLLLQHPQVEFVVNGHAHSYQRYQRMNNAAQVDTTNGIAEFICGMGGGALDTPPSARTGLAARNTATSQRGVLLFNLEPDRYTWQFVPTSDSTPALSDSGSQVVRAASPAATGTTLVPARWTYITASGTTYLPPGEVAYQDAAQWDRPTSPSTLYWQLSGTVPLDRSETVYDIDGFDNTSQTVATLKNANKYVIAYFSAGTYEDWRSDEANFPPAVLGNTVDGWAGERWLDVRALSTLRPIMEARADLAKSKGFDAIEWDNIDGYLNSTGFTISAAQQVAYVRMLADICHARGMAAIQKNLPDQVAALVSYFDGCLAEEAYRYSEVTPYLAYPQAGKPLWVIEYTGTLNCADAQAKGIYLAKYPLDLNGAPTSVCAL